MSEVIRGGAQAQPDAESEAPKFRYGPWGQFKTDGRKIEIVPAGRPGVIATVKVADEVDEANAHLIAALPDLYYALKATHRLIAEGAAEGFRPDAGDWAERLFTNQGRIYAALRKAEGCE